MWGHKANYQGFSNVMNFRGKGPFANVMNGYHPPLPLLGMPGTKQKLNTTKNIVGFHVVNKLLAQTGPATERRWGLGRGGGVMGRGGERGKGERGRGGEGEDF